MSTAHIVITGATSGIGKAAAMELAKQGHRMIIICRNAAKGKALVQELAQDGGPEHSCYVAELSSPIQVQTVCEEILQKERVVDILINNAGVLGFSEHRITPEGFEATVAINYLAPWLIAQYLLPPLEESKGKIINVNSVVHKWRRAQFDLQDWNMEKDYSAMTAYARSKLMSMMFTRSLAIKEAQRGVEVHAVHPGTVATAIDRTWPGWFQMLYRVGKPFMLNAEQGADSIVWLSNTHHEDDNGSYWVKRRCKPHNPLADRDDLRSELWDLTRERLEKWLPQNAISS